MASTVMPVVRTETPTRAAPCGSCIIARIWMPRRLQRIHSSTAESTAVAQMMAPTLSQVMRVPPISSAVRSIHLPNGWNSWGSGFCSGPNQIRKTWVPVSAMASVAIRLRIWKLGRSCSGRNAMPPTMSPASAPVRTPAMPTMSASSPDVGVSTRCLEARYARSPRTRT